jgi:tetratricopeptide (TPR) repeat protein
MKRFCCLPDSDATAADYNRRGAEAMLRRAWREASFFLLAAVVSDPHFWPAFFNLGNCWARLNEDEAALWAYRQAVRECEDYAPLYLNLGIIYLRQGRCRESIPYLEQAFRLEPERVEQVTALGYAWYRLGEYALSWYWYRQALRLSPRDRKIRKSLILVGRKILAEG